MYQGIFLLGTLGATYSVSQALHTAFGCIYIFYICEPYKSASCLPSCPDTKHLMLLLVCDIVRCLLKINNLPIKQALHPFLNSFRIILYASLAL